MMIETHVTQSQSASKFFYDVFRFVLSRINDIYIILPKGLSWFTHSPLSLDPSGFALHNIPAIIEVVPYKWSQHVSYYGRSPYCSFRVQPYVDGNASQ